MRMLSKLFTIAALVRLGSSQSLGGLENLADGTYGVNAFTNGTISVQSLDNPHAPPVLAKVLDASPVKIEKRYTSCWGQPLDHNGVDISVQGLRTWAGSGTGLQSPQDGNRWVIVQANGMWAYYCINAPNLYGNIDVTDVNYALVKMDTTCGSYTASYFQWDGTPEIIGKCRQGTAICLG